MPKDRGISALCLSSDAASGLSYNGCMPSVGFFMQTGVAVRKQNDLQHGGSQNPGKKGKNWATKLM